MNLAAFLERAARTPFDYGTFDCCLMPADWIWLKRGVDPAADLRGRYATAIGCARVLAREGGVLAVFARCVASVGLEPTTAPLEGDVGVVDAETSKGREAVGAICTGPRWAILGRPGLIVAPFVPLTAWRL